MTVTAHPIQQPGVGSQPDPVDLMLDSLETALSHFQAIPAGARSSQAQRSRGQALLGLLDEMGEDLIGLSLLSACPDAW